MTVGSLKNNLRGHPDNDEGSLRGRRQVHKSGAMALSLLKEFRVSGRLRLRPTHPNLTTSLCGMGSVLGQCLLYRARSCFFLVITYPHFFFLKKTSANALCPVSNAPLQCHAGCDRSKVDLGTKGQGLVGRVIL